MKVGIAGVRGSGKTTVFNALTGLAAETGYGGSRKVNLGAIKVPDERLDRLAEIEKPKKVTYAEITFADVPAGEGEQKIDPKSITDLREMDALALVLRGFENGVEPPRPLAELNELVSEFILNDMAIIEKRLDKIKKDLSQAKEKELLERLYAWLETGKPLSKMSLSEEEKKGVKGFAFLSHKPVIAVLNVDDENAKKPVPPDLVKHACDEGLGLLALNGRLEMEICTLGPEEQAEFLSCMGIERSARDRFIREAFNLLDLIVFFTYGPTECRTWPIKKGTTAVEAAAQIHSDIARGFIRAEIMRIEDYLVHQTEAKVKAAGGLKFEGKTYVIKDGDCCHIRFNV